MSGDDLLPETEGPRCLCGQWVAVPHKECLAMADPDTLDRFRGGSGGAA